MYGQSSELYPLANFQQRAIINSRLMFDLTTLYPCVFKHLMSIFKKRPIDEENSKNISKALKILNEFLSQSKYVASDSLTLADISIFVSITTLEAIDDGIDVNIYKNVWNWLEMLRNTIPGREINQAGIEVTKKWIASSAEFSRRGARKF